MSANEETGEIGYKRVKNTFVRKTETLVHVKVNGEVINTTEEHPFYAEGKGWTKAKDLKNGDLLRLADGGTKAVEETETEKLKESVKVYNFEVEDWHTYFVSKCAFLVHNDCFGANNVITGNSRAPKTNRLGTVYEQVDSKGNVMSRSKYGENGKIEYRDDLMGRPHYDKNTGKYLTQHRHVYKYNSQGQPIGETVIPIPK